MKKHEFSVFLIVGAVLVIAVALIFYSGGKFGAASSAIENVKCVFKNSEDQQKCYLAGGPVIVISPPNKVCYGVNECKLKVKSQPGGVAKWKSSCSDQEFKTVVDGRNDVVEFMCPSPIKFYATPSPVYFDHGFTVYWDATNVGADSCGGWGSSVPLDTGGSWAKSMNLGPKGKLGLIGRHAALGFVHQLQLGIQCWKEGVEVGRAEIMVPVWNPGLNVEFSKQEYTLGEDVNLFVGVAAPGVIVNDLYVYLVPSGVPYEESISPSSLIAHFTNFESTNWEIDSSLITTAGKYMLVACIDEKCSDPVIVGFKVV